MLSSRGAAAAALTRAYPPHHRSAAAALSASGGGIGTGIGSRHLRNASIRRFSSRGRHTTERPLQQRYHHPSRQGRSAYARPLSTTTTTGRHPYSSIQDPDPSLFRFDNIFASTSVSSLTDLNDEAEGAPKQQDLDAQLRADVRVMGSLLGNIITDHHGQSVFDQVEKLRSLAKAWRESGAGRDPTKSTLASHAFSQMSNFASDLNSEELTIISRAFTHFLAIANAAESHHRARLNRSSLVVTTDGGGGNGGVGALPTKRDSCGGAIHHLVDEVGVDPKVVWETLCTQTVELVLTAHPTEVNRRTLLDKQKRVQELLTEADDNRNSATGNGRPITPYVRSQLDSRLHREISSIWQSDEVSRTKPTPQNEAERGTLVVDKVLWEALPAYLRKLDATMRSALGGDAYGLPLTSAPIKFSSWMGGDRDGNPNVTPDVTREVCLSNRAKAARLLREDIDRLSATLSITNCTEEMRSRSGGGAGDAREPYRIFLQPIIDKLKATEAWAKDGLERLQNGGGTTSKESIRVHEIYLSKADLMEELTLVHRSLCETGNEITADGMLSDIIRNVSSFGLTLVPLDIRQESDRHEEAVDCITRYLGLGSYAQWDEATRLSWLQKELSSHRPLLRPGEWNENGNVFPPTAVDTLETFRMISEQYDDSLGAYVISQATSASDVLAVLLLQRDAGVKEPLRVAPLFETLEDLQGAAETMETLFSLPAYKGSIDGKQEVMIGYSDSAKDAGRLAASWAQFETQEVLAEVAAKHAIDLTFFHGKGGTVGRGGNPATFDAILAHAPNTINSKFRVTEQGEMINQNLGFFDRAERTMDIYTAAVVSEKHISRPTPTPEWREMMAKLSQISCNAYRDIVRGDPRFVPYFRSATPELELSELNIGSRPAKRKATGGVESLRAIPWIFAWTQTRLNLPTWLGVGEAIREVLDSNDADKLRTMYKDWGSFSTTVDLVEMVLAKSEPSIAAHYDNKLVHEEKAKELGQHVRKVHADTEAAVLELTGHTTLSEDNTTLRRALQVRNPYVDALNILQAETLHRLRNCNDEEEEKVLKDALLTTITGVANGMGNTG